MKRKPFVLPAIAPADPTQWSETSQNSVAASFCAHYVDKHYRCRYCDNHTVFTAQEQKRVYEVKKTHIDKQRVLCGNCHRARREVATRIASCQAQWAGAKQALMHAPAFLSQWRALLLEHARYGARCDGAAIGMLDKLLGQAAAGAATHEVGREG